MTRVHAKKARREFRRLLAGVAVLSLILAATALAERTQLKPGWNLFSPQQDVEIGTQISADAERQLPIWNNARVDRYLNDLGRKLAEKAPGAKYPYQFKAVNDSSINAFALPGGFLYINRGTIEAADNEAQLAGVIAHEIAHVALRHGTNQASKAYAAQVPLAILGGQLGSNSTGAVLAQVGAGFAVNSLLLKYSRDAERQADALGTQILYDSGYDPRAMAQFFDKIQAASKGGQPPEFFSSHPSPENRTKLVYNEVDKLGGNPRGSNTDSGDFRDIKQYAQSQPAAPQGSQLASAPAPTSSGRPQLPSRSVQRFENGVVRIEYPENWRASGQGDAVTFAPAGGIVSDGQGNNALAYGMLVNVYEPHRDDYYQRLQPEGYGQSGALAMTVEQATDQLIEELRRGNPQLRVIQQHERIQIAGERGLSTVLTNNSPLANTRERDWLVTVLRPEGLMFFVAVAPEGEFDGYNRAFEKMFNSARFLGTASSAPPPVERPGLPSTRVQRFENSLVRIEHPENWRARSQGDAVTFAPEGGLIADSQGHGELAYGMMVNLYQPQQRGDYYQSLQPEGYDPGRAPALTVEQATDQLVEELRRDNAQMRVIQGRQAIQIGGERGLSTVLTNDSPLANTRERNWLVTVLRPEGLLFFVAVAPEGDFQDYNSAFEKMLDSARFPGTGPRTDPGTGPSVSLYTDQGFRGKSEVVSGSDPDLSDNAIGNDQVTSIRVPAGYVVTLYSDANYRGRSVVLREDESDLGRTALGNDELSSIRIEWVGTKR